MVIMIQDKTSVCVWLCEYKLTSKRLWEPCSCQQEMQKRFMALEKHRGGGGGGVKKEAVHDSEQRHERKTGQWG